jgi:hypothetical protein
MRRRSLLGGATVAALALPAILRSTAGAAVPDDTPAAAEVDTLLVLAVDVSRSMDEEEAGLQRAGYVSALRDVAVHEAIQGGAIGAIGLCYLEWSGMEHQTLVVPWTRIAGAAEAEHFARRLAASQLGIGTWTSISAGLDRARALLAEAPFDAARLVVDVSGDGANNSGPPVEEARDRAVADGITINGLPVVKGPALTGYGTAAMPLDAYYRESVVGGAGAFVLGVEDFANFAPAVRRKLVLEIAGDAAGAAPGRIG